MASDNTWTGPTRLTSAYSGPADTAESETPNGRSCCDSRFCCIPRDAISTSRCSLAVVRGVRSVDCCGLFVCRARRSEARIQQMLWKVSYSDIVFINTVCISWSLLVSDAVMRCLCITTMLSVRNYCSLVYVCVCVRVILFLGSSDHSLDDYSPGN